MLDLWTCFFTEKSYEAAKADPTISSPEASTLKANMYMIGSLIQGNLHPVAYRAMGKALLASDECDSVCDPNGKHDQIYVNKQLDAVAEVIKRDPRTFDKFYSCLTNIGGPVADMAKDMSKLYCMSFFRLC